MRRGPGETGSTEPPIPHGLGNAQNHPVQTGCFGCPTGPDTLPLGALGAHHPVVSSTPKAESPYMLRSGSFSRWLGCTLLCVAATKASAQRGAQADSNRSIINQPADQSLR